MGSKRQELYSDNKNLKLSWINLRYRDSVQLKVVNIKILNFKI